VSSPLILLLKDTIVLIFENLDIEAVDLGGACHLSANRHDVATHCNTLQHTATHCDTMQRTATHCNALQHTATHCNTLECTAVHCNILQYTATHCNALQHTATHCSTLHHIATHCNTLQHTATPRHAQTASTLTFLIIFLKSQPAPALTLENDYNSDF